MAKNKEEVDLAPSISRPTSGSTESVFAMMPNATQGLLCFANGTVTFPSGSTPDGVYLLCLDGTPTTLPTKEQVVATVNSTTARGKKISIPGGSGTSVSWTCNQQLTATCATAPATNNNTLLAVTASSQYVPGQGYVSILEGPAQVAFKGKSANSCGMPMGAADGKAQSADDFIEPEIHPVDRDGDWLHYCGIDAGTAGLGSVLMLDGKPLSARVLSVAASRVCWWHGGKGLPPQIVNRAAGELRIDDVTTKMPFYLFPDISHSGIVLNQFTHQTFNVGAVSSHCRDQADMFSFDPDYRIRVQVNGKRDEVRTGSYDLWIKVVTR